MDREKWLPYFFVKFNADNTETIEIFDDTAK